MEILPTDIGFNSTRCRRWELYEAPAAPAATFGDGDWVVGEQIEPGQYRSDGSGTACYWERAGGFSHDFNEIISNENATGPTVVALSPGERFTAARCGTWTHG